jgi:hypothetical protein
MTTKLRGARLRLVELMRAGHKLMWWGDNGPELDGFPNWPQKRTVRSLIRDGMLEWGPPNNSTQDKCGIRPVVLTKELKQKKELLT